MEVIQIEREDGSIEEIPLDKVRGGKFKAAGVERELEAKELFQFASKGFGADAKFREASETLAAARAEKEANKAATTVFETLKQFQQQKDPQSFLQFAKAAGLDAGEAENIWNGLMGQPQEQSAATGKISLQNLPPEVLRAVQRVNELEQTGLNLPKVLSLSANQLEETAEEKAKARIRGALKGNPLLTKIARRGADAESALVDRLYDGLESRVNAGQKFQKALEEVVATEARTAELYGVGEGGTQFPGMFPDGSTPANLRGVKFHDDKPPTIEPRDINRKGAVAALANAVIAYDQANPEE